MNKVFSFLAGALSGTLVGAAAVLLFTPASGEELRGDVMARLEAARQEFNRVYDETYRQKTDEFERMKSGA